MVFVTIYLLIGSVIALVVYGRRHQPREREIGHLMLLLMSPALFWLPLLLWPLWLLLLAFPQSSFVEEKMPPAVPPKSLVGLPGVVLLPLAPLGRINVEGVHYDARAEFGTLPKGAEVVIIAHGVGGELVVKEANPAPEPNTRDRHAPC
jgi:membrane-bound ClpP family serine protease